MSLPSKCEVLVVGSGNAGFSAAISAIESGAKEVIIIDKCPRKWAGGNTYFTAGAYRTVHGGLQDLLPVVNNVKDEEHASKIDLDPYTQDDFERDMQRVCDGRSDPELTKILIGDSNGAIKWLAGNGVRFQLSFNRQSYEIDDRIKFWGGLTLKTQDGGKGLVQDHINAAERHGIKTCWETALSSIQFNELTEAHNEVVVEVTHHNTTHTITTTSLILAGGGFESNPSLRSQHLGQDWSSAHVRGTPYNTGDCLSIAQRDLNAKPVGDWSGCHSVAWDFDSPFDTGDQEISNEFTKSGYPLGLMLNVHGERFVDEGIDLRNYTYAKFGRAILQQPGHVAFQVYDQQTIPLLRSEEYREERVKRVMADTIEELAEKLSHPPSDPSGDDEEAVLKDKSAFINTITSYNNAVHSHRLENPDIKFNPAIKDNLSTESSAYQPPLSPPKSNWALPTSSPPFLAVKVTCGITFTFGGLAVDPQTAGLINGKTGQIVPGIYCAGEMLGGLFYGNYPGGSGLTSGAVFGRRAGRAAAERVMNRRRENHDDAA